jgi:hypothetical protein
MKPRQPFILLFSVLALSTCKVDDGESGNDQTDPAIAAQIELCGEMCLKPFCDPTLEPAPGVEDECMTHCTETVAAAQNDECTDQYQDFLECLEGLSCDDFYLWAGMEPGAPCVMGEEQLESNCPGVEVRNENG